MRSRSRTSANPSVPTLRYMTPVGPISLDYGFKLNRRGRQVIRNCRTTEPMDCVQGPESIGEVHFSISAHV